MSVRAVLAQRLDQAMSKVNFPSLGAFAFVSLFAGGIVYAMISGILNDPRTSPEGRLLAQNLVALFFYAVEGLAAIFVAIGLFKIVWDVRKEARDYAQKLGTEPAQTSQNR
jgi:hypothetical protein